MAREMICCPLADVWPVIFFISHFGIPELFSFFTTVFLALWLVKFFSGHRSFSGEFSFMFFMIVFMVFFPIGVFLYQTLQTGLSMTVRSNGPLFFISLGRFSRYHLNNMTGHLSSFPVANILGVTSLVFTLSPPCLVLVGPSAKVRNSFPSSSHCKVKSSTFIWWCSCRPRRPKCWVSSHHMVLSRARGVPPPSWPLCQRTSSSSFVKLLDRFGRFPLPCSRSFLAFPSRTFLELRNSLSRMIDFG